MRYLTILSLMLRPQLFISEYKQESRCSYELASGFSYKMSALLISVLAISTLTLQFLLYNFKSCLLHFLQFWFYRLVELITVWPFIKIPHTKTSSLPKQLVFFYNSLYCWGRNKMANNVILLLNIKLYGKDPKSYSYFLDFRYLI